MIMSNNRIKNKKQKNDTENKSLRICNMWKMYTEAKSFEQLCDIEAGSVASKLITDGSVAVNVTANEDVSVKKDMIFIKSFVSGVIIICCSPFIICDLYYAYTDNSCVHNPTKKSMVDLYTYLLVSGYYGLCSLAIVVCGMMAIDIEKERDNELGNMLFLLITYISTLFSTSWIVVGAVVFWNEVDNSTCDKPIYNYLYASIIIKLICCFLSWNSSNEKKKE